MVMVMVVVVTRRIFSSLPRSFPSSPLWCHIVVVLMLVNNDIASASIEKEGWKGKEESRDGDW
jgi:hypothetical protein